MKESDDGKLVDGTDAGAVPATSTIQLRKTHSLMGQDVHGVKQEIPEWYYTPNEWSRSIGWGTVPDERNSLKGVNQDRRTDEKVPEDTDTKT